MSSRTPRRYFVTKTHFKDQILSSQTPALHRSELVLRQRLRRGLVGSLCPNADLGDGRRLDEATAGRFAVVTTVSPPSALRAMIERQGGVVLTVERDTELHGTGL